jgi:hypothetical protein
MAQLKAGSTAGGQVIATQDWVTSTIVDGAPSALNTLNELAAAINDNSSYAASITTALAGKLSTTGKAADSDKLDGYHASSFWRNGVNNTWSPSTNILLPQSANSQEWSFDITRNGYTGGYWQVWDSSNSTMLKVDAVSGKVSAPYGFVGNLQGNITGSAASATTAGSATTATTATNLGSSYTADTWFRATGDNNTVKFYGNSRMMVFRTDGEGGDTGHTGYAFKWTYGGDGTGNTLMLLDNNGNVWTKSYGWLHSKFDAAGSANAVDTALSGRIDNELKPDIGTAQTTADNAAAAAAAAQSTANVAETRANGAKDAAADALAAAEAAQATANGKLGATAKAADSNKLDGIDSSSFLRSDADDTLTQTLVVDQTSSGSISYKHGGGVYVPRPNGGSYSTTSSSHTGAIAIKLPTASWGDSDMLSFWVDIYDYAGGAAGESVSLYIYGYQYGTTDWTNCGAVILSDKTDRDYAVRFGHDGTRPIVWIGETGSTWNYLQISVRDFQAGYSGDDWNRYDDGWAVAVNQTSFGTVTDTSTANYPVSKYAASAGSANAVAWANVTGKPSTFTPSGHKHGVADITGAGDIFVKGIIDVSVSNDTFTFTTNNGGTFTRSISDANTWRGIDDTPVNGQTAESISSNWAYDHVNASNPHGTTLADLGYTGATNANYITNNNQLTNGAGYVTSSGNTIIGTDSDINTSGYDVIDNLYMTDGVITSHGTRQLHNVRIQDTRAAEKTPNDYLDYAVSFDFTDRIVSGWHSTMTLQGWHDGYAAWQIIGPANNSTHENWYLRSGINTTWGSLRKIWHNGNFNPASYLTTSGKAADSEKLDGINSTQFLRSDANDTHGGTLALTGITAASGGTIANNQGSYLHLGVWAKGRTDAGAVLVNTAYRSDILSYTRSFTIGNTARNFNGSANVSWTLAEIGAEVAGAAGALDNELRPLIGNAQTTADNAVAAAAAAQTTADTAETRANGAKTDAANALTVANSKLGATAKAADANKLDGYDWMQSGKNVRASEFYADGWLRNYNSGTGLYNQATTQHWYSDGDDYWNIAGGGSFNAIRFRDDHGGTQRGLVAADNSNRIGFLDAGGSWAVRHDNDSGTLFYTDNETLEFRVGRDKVTGNYGTVQTDSTRGGWGGYSIAGRVLFMHDHSNGWGIYNDVNNEWMIYGALNGQVELKYNNSTKLATNNGGVTVTGTVTATAFSGNGSGLTNLPIPDQSIPVTINRAENTTLASMNINIDRGQIEFTLQNGETFSAMLAR